MAAILNSANLNSAILDSTILVFPLKLTHTCQDWFPPFAQKNFTWFILTQLDDGSHLEFCHLGFSHLFFQICSKTLSNSDSNFTQSHSFWLTWIAAIEFCHLGSILHKKNFTHSFWLNLMMTAILNSAMMDSDTLLFFSQIHSKPLSLSTLTLTQTNSIWLKVIHSH